MADSIGQEKEKEREEKKKKKKRRKKKRSTPKRSSNRRRPLSPYLAVGPWLGFQAAFHFCSNRVSGRARVDETVWGPLHVENWGNG